MFSSFSFIFFRQQFTIFLTLSIFTINVFNFTIVQYSVYCWGWKSDACLTDLFQLQVICLKYKCLVLIGGEAWMVNYKDSIIVIEGLWAELLLLRWHFGDDQMTEIYILTAQSPCKSCIHYIYFFLNFRQFSVKNDILPRLIVWPSNKGDGNPLGINDAWPCPHFIFLSQVKIKWQILFNQQ